MKFKTLNVQAYKKKAIRLIKQRNRLIINRAKMSPCADCKVQYNPWVMQFDHRDPKVKFDDISNGSTWGLKRLLEEIAKCDVVCANCHMERSYRDRYSWPNGVRPRTVSIEAEDGQTFLFADRAFSVNGSQR